MIRRASPLLRFFLPLIFFLCGRAPFLWAKEDGKVRLPDRQGKFRDPFVPLITSDGKRLDFPEEHKVDLERLSRLTFQGIVYDPEEGSYAILNGRIVREQEEIDGIKIVQIEPNRVTILVEGKEHQLVLHQLTEEAATGS